jgi:hypothetical protein
MLHSNVPDDFDDPEIDEAALDGGPHVLDWDDFTDN